MQGLTTAHYVRPGPMPVKVIESLWCILIGLKIYCTLSAHYLDHAQMEKDLKVWVLIHKEMHIVEHIDHFMRFVLVMARPWISFLFARSTAIRAIEKMHLHDQLLKINLGLCLVM
jgi:hypothetical protein